MYFLKEYTIHISELFYKWGKLVIFVVVFLNWQIISKRFRERLLVFLKRRSSMFPLTSAKGIASNMALFP